MPTSTTPKAPPYLVTGPISLGWLLRQFCHPVPQLHPGLALPFYCTANGKTLTMATDGETMALWTLDRLGRYKDFAAGPTSDNFHPPGLRGLFIGGPAEVLPAVPPKPPRIPTILSVFGRSAMVNWHTLYLLSLFDSCHLGPSRAPHLGHFHGALSLRLTFEKTIFSGILHCFPPATK